MMISPTRITAVVVMSVLFSGLVEGDSNKPLVKRICTLRHYQSHGIFSHCSLYVANDIIAMTAKRGYSYSVDGSSGDEFSGRCYGHAACNEELSPGDCTTCLNYAWSYIWNYCTDSVGAQMKLEDCRIRFEDYLFDPDY